MKILIFSEDGTEITDYNKIKSLIAPGDALECADRAIVIGKSKDAPFIQRAVRACEKARKPCSVFLLRP